MGRIKIETVDDLSSKGFDLLLECRRCKREVILDRHQLKRWHRQFKWGPYVESAARRFPCQHCGPGTVEWGVIQLDHGRPIFDLDAVARDRRDHFIVKARFWHDVSLGRDPKGFRQKRAMKRIEAEFARSRET